MVSYLVNPCQQIRESCSFVSKEAAFVHLNLNAIDKATDSIIAENTGIIENADFAWSTWHYYDGGSPLTCQYIFVLDALNFWWVW